MGMIILKNSENSAKSGIFWVRLGIDFKEKERKEFNEKR